jgi:epoxyqueuosine reductase
MASARSVISIAVSYAYPPPKLKPGYGKLSSYVWGSIDYHVWMERILDALAEIVHEVGATSVICDKRPLAERAVAARAGVGWIGKHTNLIVPGIGSYVFLGEIVTAVELPPDLPRKTHCGSCSRCTDVCPTGALRGDYTMDARRCIADLTQKRGPIPLEMRPLMGSWVWGCDLCQDVCPPTQNGKSQAHPVFAPRADAYPHLAELLVLDREHFEAKYKHTAMGWRGTSILRRNAAVALGNSLDRGYVPLLAERLLVEPAAVVREHIAWALGRIGSPAAFAALRRAAMGEFLPHVQAEIRLALKME